MCYVICPNCHTVMADVYETLHTERVCEVCEPCYDRDHQCPECGLIDPTDERIAEGMKCRFCAYAV